MNLAFYRFFFVNHGSTVAAEVLQCDGDSAAMEKAKALLSESSFSVMVVWQGTRKVGVVEKSSG